jgi:glycosyltransferase involved in cell wall biosynthesis
MKNLKFSIITPTHLKNSFLDELYDSLVSQTYTDWEWIVYLNGDASKKDIPAKIRLDSRVEIFESEFQNTNVGFNKNKAFHLGKGDVLVEIDHDDMLTEDCLEELNKAYQDEEVGFVFSDSAILHMKDVFQPYNSIYGWSHKTYNWKGMELFSMDSFEPSSKSMAFIWYAPDHVRSWRKSVYVELGGHDPSYDICDDHELMIRTYLKTKMVHIPKVLYIYRITGNNTWLERNEKIQTTTMELFNKNIWDLSVREAKLRNLNVVELGGGINPKHGTDINIDLEEGNLQHDLNNGIPLADNSVGVIYASHIIEHLHDKHKIMKEIHRVLADGGWAFIEVPSTDGRGAFQDPTHVSYWNENCFWYYTRADKAAFIRNKDIRFQAFRLDTIWWDNNIAITNAWLVAKKNEERRPHLSTI